MSFTSYKRSVVRFISFKGVIENFGSSIPAPVRKKVKGRHLRSAAFFDLDGTLLRGLMIQAFPRYLADRRKISETFPSKIDTVVDAYGKGTISYMEVAKKVPKLYAAGIKGLKIDKVKIMAEGFMETYFPTKVFRYSKRLVRDARKLVDLTIAISGSPQEVVSEIGKYLPFDEVYGSLFTTRAGVYTGTVKRNLILGKPKGDLIDELSHCLMIDLSRSLAFGDTDQDGPVLRRVSLPMAINPNPSLLKLCIRNHWPWYAEENPLRLVN